MTAATANTGIMFTNLFRIRLICHELGYVKILGNVPIILSFGNSNRLQTAFIPYITAGDPDLATTAEALRLLDACGADVIELGLPFSDPDADGPVIQARSHNYLASNAIPPCARESGRAQALPDPSCNCSSIFRPQQRGRGRWRAALRWMACWRCSRR